MSMNNPQFDKQFQGDLSKVRVTKGKVEAPTKANGKDGIVVGSYRLPKRDKREPGQRGWLARLFRR